MSQKYGTRTQIQEQSVEAPPSHEKEAWKIVSGPGTLEEKSQRLQELQELYPDDKTIADWGSALEDEYELELMRAEVEGQEPAPEAPGVPSEGQDDSEPIDTSEAV